MSKSYTVVHRGMTLRVKYVRTEDLEFYLGYAFPSRRLALVREKLPLRVKRFVTAHELHHLVDTYKWGGWLGREIRATLVPGISDPIGMLSTVWFIFRKRGLKSYFEKIFLRKDLPKPPNY